jgi:hypothetical protein
VGESNPAARRSHEFKATPEFFKSLNSLSTIQRLAADKAFEVFKADPFDPSLRTHKIHKLSARYRTTVWSVCILGDLRAVFCIDDNRVISLDIGTHNIYQ